MLQSYESVPHYLEMIHDRINLADFTDVCQRCAGDGVIDLGNCRGKVQTCPNCRGLGVAVEAIENLEELVSA